MGKIENLDFKKRSLRKINSFLQNIDFKNNKRDFTIKNPSGKHAICAGLKENMLVKINGHVGYYCGGMNKKANIIIEGNAGTGLGENMMSGTIHVKGNTSQSTGATAHGGTIIVDGDASSRCGISMKGVDIIVEVGGGNTLEQSIKASKTGAVIGIIGVLSGGTAQLPIGRAIAKSSRLIGITCGNQEDLTDLCLKLDHSNSKPVIDSIYGFDKLPEALSYMKQGKHLGKIVIDFEK